MAAPIRARNVVHNLRWRLQPGYANVLEHRRLREWRTMLADGRLTPDMLSPEQRVQLQTWIIEHPRRKGDP